MTSKYEKLTDNEWLKREAEGNVALLGKLVEREMSADELATTGQIHNPEGHIKYLEKNAQVEELKADLGIDPLDQP